MRNSFSKRESWSCAPKTKGEEHVQEETDKNKSHAESDEDKQKKDN